MPIHPASTRRTFLAAALGALTVPAFAGSAHAQEAEDCCTAADEALRPVPPGGIGMHLYTMRSTLATDFQGTLDRLAAMGYATVGVSGRHGHSAEAIRGMLDASGLKAVLEHVPYTTVAGSGLQQAIEDVRTLGAKWVVVPSLPGSMHSPAGYREAARVMNQAGAVAREVGLQVLFHNHATDHATVEGEVLFDILVNETDPEFFGFELDLYWAVKGGADPRRYFLNHPGRFPALHVKDMTPEGGFADVGSGVLDFPSMFDAARCGGVKQWLVEHDTPADPFATALNSYRYLSTVRY